MPTTGPNLTQAGEAPPVMPILATMDSAPGAIEFAKFFMKTIEWGFATTSSTYMRHYFEATCARCSGIAGGLDDAKKVGNHFVGNQFLNMKAIVVPVDDADTDVSVRVVCDLTAGQSLDKDGKALEGAAPHPGLTEQLYLGRRGDHWVVVDMVRRA